MVTLKHLHDFHIGDRVEIEVKDAHHEYISLGYIKTMNPLYVHISMAYPKGKKVNPPDSEIHLTLEEIANIVHLKVDH